MKNGNNRRPQLCEAWSAACGNGPTSGAIGMGEYVGFWRSPFLAQTAPPLAPSEGLEPPGGREIDIRVARGPECRRPSRPGGQPAWPGAGPEQPASQPASQPAGQPGGRGVSFLRALTAPLRTRTQGTTGVRLKSRAPAQLRCGRATLCLLGRRTCRPAALTTPEAKQWQISGNSVANQWQISGKLVRTAFPRTMRKE